MQLMGKMETIYAEISDVLDCMEEKNRSFGHQMSGTIELQNHIMELKDLLKKERNDYIVSAKLSITCDYDWYHMFTGPWFMFMPSGICVFLI